MLQMLLMFLIIFGLALLFSTLNDELLTPSLIKLSSTLLSSVLKIWLFYCWKRSDYYIELSSKVLLMLLL